MSLGPEVMQAVERGYERMAEDYARAVEKRDRSTERCAHAVERYERAKKAADRAPVESLIGIMLGLVASVTIYILVY